MPSARALTAPIDLLIDVYVNDAAAYEECRLFPRLHKLHDSSYALNYGALCWPP